MTDKVYRIVAEDLDEDGKEDLTVRHGTKKVVTVYDWRSVVVSWVCSTAALFVAGMGVCTFGL